MSVKNRSRLGALLFVGAAQFILVMTVAEALYPGYNMATNYISDLGRGVDSTFVQHVRGVVRSDVTPRRSVRQAFPWPPLMLTLALAGAGAAGVGLFPETTGAPHQICALIAFFFGAVSAIISYRITRRPLSYFSVVLGVIALAALALYFSHYDLGIGRGGMERMIAYPSLVWVLGFGGFMIGST